MTQLTLKKKYFYMLNSKGYVIISINQARIISVYLLECKEGRGSDYRGTEAKTQKGVECQKWADTAPHKPKYELYKCAHVFLKFC